MNEDKSYLGKAIYHFEGKVIERWLPLGSLKKRILTVLVNGVSCIVTDQSDLIKGEKSLHVRRFGISNVKS